MFSCVFRIDVLAFFERIFTHCSLGCESQRSAIPYTSNCSPDFRVKTCANFEESKKAS